MSEGSGQETITGAPEIGGRMPDGTVYAGISPDTGAAMYTTPTDAVARRWLLPDRLTSTFNQARKCAAKLDAHGHQDWRVPTKGELNVLFQNRAAIGGFNETGSPPAGWYWSSSQGTEYPAWAQRVSNDGYLAWAQRFSNGYQRPNYVKLEASLRCVR